MGNCLYQPIKFKRNEKSDWETGNMYIYINTHFTVIEDKDNNEINPDIVYDYKANWFGED